MATPIPKQIRVTVLKSKLNGIVNVKTVSRSYFLGHGMRHYQVLNEDLISIWKSRALHVTPVSLNGEVCIRYLEPL